MRYLPHTDDEIQSMLKVIGVAETAALFSAVPEADRLDRALDLEPALDEMSLMSHLSALANKNSGAQMLSFLGAGMYHHHIPPAVDQLLLRSEFYTAYTPYQAELSQGTLQAIFEFQTTVCELFGTDVANASMYDGASAAAEAVLMARRITGRTATVVSDGVHPHYRTTIAAYLKQLDGGEPDVTYAPLGGAGTTDVDSLKDAISDKTAAVVVGYPNFVGCIEDLASLARVAQATGTLLIVANAEPYALGVLEAPAALGADIVVGEGQPLALPPQYGGPGVGLFGARQKFVRQMPGRLVGQTVDATGKRGFVLTLSTREQHIRRERATSNICTNHGLIALAMTIRTAMLGKKGFVETAEACLANAEHLKTNLSKLPGVSLPYSAPTFNEFVVRLSDGNAVDRVANLAGDGILAGVARRDLEPQWPNDLLIATTERHSKADLDRLVNAIGDAARS